MGAARMSAQWAATITNYTLDDLKALQESVRIEMLVNPDGCIARGLAHFTRTRQKEMSLSDMFYLWIPLAEKVKAGEDITNPPEQKQFTVEPAK